MPADFPYHIQFIGGRNGIDVFLCKLQHIMIISACHALIIRNDQIAPDPIFFWNMIVTFQIDIIRFRRNMSANSGDHRLKRIEIILRFLMLSLCLHHLIG